MARKQMAQWQTSCNGTWADTACAMACKQMARQRMTRQQIAQWHSLHNGMQANGTAANGTMANKLQRHVSWHSLRNGMQATGTTANGTMAQPAQWHASCKGTSGSWHSLRKKQQADWRQLAQQIGPQPLQTRALSLFCLLVKEFYGTRYQSGFLFIIQCGEWFSLPAYFFFSLRGWHQNGSPCSHHWCTNGVMS